MVQAQVAVDQHVDPLRGSLSVNGHAVSMVQREEATMSVVALISIPTLEFNHTSSSTAMLESHPSPNFVGSASFSLRKSPAAPGRLHDRHC